MKADEDDRQERKRAILKSGGSLIFRGDILGVIMNQRQEELVAEFRRAMDEADEVGDVPQKNLQKDGRVKGDVHEMRSGHGRRIFMQIEARW